MGQKLGKEIVHVSLQRKEITFFPGIHFNLLSSCPKPQKTFKSINNYINIVLKFEMQLEYTISFAKIKRSQKNDSSDNLRLDDMDIIIQGKTNLATYGSLGRVVGL